MKTMTARFVLLTMFVVSSRAVAQEVYHNCGMEGSATNAKVKALNVLKNRYTIPSPADLDPGVSLRAMLKPGDDAHRWNNHRAAEITGYVYDVRPGGIESCNCGAKNVLYRDTHISLVLDPMHENGDQRVIAEVTPRIREIMKTKGKDWTTGALRKTLLGRWVKIKGWLMFDFEHKGQSENTHPGGKKNWRATAWEIHPITGIEIVSRPAH